MRATVHVWLVASALAVQAQTPNVRARNLSGIALSNAGKHEEAIEQFRSALRQDPKFIPALKNLAMAELQLGRNADARRHFETALKAAPNDPVVHFGLGQLDRRERRFTRAVWHFERSGDLYSRDANALLQYAASCVEIKQTAKAIRSLERLPVEAAGPFHFEAGLLLAKLEQYDAAARQFALANGPGTGPYNVAFNLTLARFNAKQYAAAVDAANELADRGLATVELYSLQSKAYEAAGKTKEAYNALRSAVRLNPGDETPYLELIALCVAHENYELAFEIADFGLRVNPQASRIRVDRGIVLALTGRMEEAEREFAKAGESQPGEMLPPLARSIALMEMNRLPEAIELLRERKRLKPDHYLIEWHLAEALIRAGGAEDEAIQALRRSIGLNGSVARTHFLLGKLLSLTGQTQPAVRELEAVLRLEPDDVSALYLLAQTYRKKGDSARASELFAKVTQAKAEAAERQAGRGSLMRIVRDGAR